MIELKFPPEVEQMYGQEKLLAVVKAITDMHTSNTLPSAQYQRIITELQEGTLSPEGALDTAKGVITELSKHSTFNPKNQQSIERFLSIDLDPNATVIKSLQLTIASELPKEPTSDSPEDVVKFFETYRLYHSAMAQLLELGKNVDKSVRTKEWHNNRAAQAEEMIHKYGGMNEENDNPNPQEVKQETTTDAHPGVEAPELSPAANSPQDHYKYHLAHLQNHLGMAGSISGMNKSSIAELIKNDKYSRGYGTGSIREVEPLGLDNTPFPKPIATAPVQDHLNHHILSAIHHLHGAITNMAGATHPEAVKNREHMTATMNRMKQRVGME